MALVIVVVAETVERLFGRTGTDPNATMKNLVTFRIKRVKVRIVGVVLRCRNRKNRLITSMATTVYLSRTYRGQI